MSVSYGWQKLHGAVLTLAQSESSVRERLISAYQYQLSSLVIAEDMPPELQDEMARLDQSITRVPQVGDEGSIAATVRAMSDQEVDEAVEAIISLYDGVARHLGQHDLV